MTAVVNRVDCPRMRRAERRPDVTTVDIFAGPGEHRDRHSLDRPARTDREAGDAMNEAERLARIAASLMSENGENPEYDRAAVEIISDFVGIDMDKRDDVTALLRFIGQNPGALVILNWITGYDG